MVIRSPPACATVRPANFLLMPQLVTRSVREYSASELQLRSPAYSCRAESLRYVIGITQLHQQACTRLQVGALVDGLDDAQVPLEVGDQRAALVREILRLARDLTVQRLQPFPRDACDACSSELQGGARIRDVFQSLGKYRVAFMFM